MIYYEEENTFLDKARELGTKPGLERINELLDKLNRPQDDLKAIQVAGTNGKGSVCTMLSSALTSCGYKVGKFLSPAVFSENERYTIDNVEITDEEKLSIIDIIKNKCSLMDDHPTIFEIEVALALVYFQRKQCDFVVIETGMGGTFDATNVFKENICSLITSIGYDHMQFLGDSLTEIAKNKAGIIKKNCYGISVEQESEVTKALVSETQKIDAKFEFLDYRHIRYNMKNHSLTLREFKNVKLPFLGDFQFDNTALVLEALHIMRYQGIKIDIEKAKDGISNAHLPGRLEKIVEEPLVYIDGCHNQPAALRIKETIEKHFTNKSITFIIGVLKDKEVNKILQTLLPICDAVITVTPNNPRALSANMLANMCFNYDVEVGIASDFDDAAIKAIEYDNDIIIALGSLSYLKDIKKAILGRR